MNFRKRWESVQPPGASKKAVKELFQVALRCRDALWGSLRGMEAPVLRLSDEEVDDLAIALTGMADDLRADAGIWRALEAWHMEFYGVPLPLLCQPGDGALARFDARRFQFFFYTVWRHFQPGYRVSPEHAGIVELAHQASTCFQEAFAEWPHRSPAGDFLAGSDRWGWEVKRKLIWLGEHSFLFRFDYRDYVAQRSPAPQARIAVTDDFLCQKCTGWSGLGALDILAGALDLPEEDRPVLRGWHERHAAIYRIVSLEMKGRMVATIRAVNLVNDQFYDIRMDADARTNPFQKDKVVYGSLVMWREEWYWSGQQELMNGTPQEVAALRKSFRENGRIVFRYCPDLEKRAREIEAEHFADFTRFYGGDLTVFPDGLAAAASEQKRMRLYSEAKAGGNREKLLRKHGLENFGGASYPAGFLQNTDSVALFYHAGEGCEMSAGYGALLSGLKKTDGSLTDDERELVQAFVEEDAISPAFVRRVVGETGTAALEKLYFLPENSHGLDYLLRRFKGCCYRKRYPQLSLRE